MKGYIRDTLKFLALFSLYIEILSPRVYFIPGFPAPTMAYGHNIWCPPRLVAPTLDSHMIGATQFLIFFWKGLYENQFNWIRAWSNFCSFFCQQIRHYFLCSLTDGCCYRTWPLHSQESEVSTERIEDVGLAMKKYN